MRDNAMWDLVHLIINFYLCMLKADGTFHVASNVCFFK